MLESELGLGFTFLQFLLLLLLYIKAWPSELRNLLSDQILSQRSWTLQPCLSSPPERLLKPNLENSCAVWQMTSDPNQLSSSAYFFEENMEKDKRNANSRLWCTQHHLIQSYHQLWSAYRDQHLSCCLYCANSKQSSYEAGQLRFNGNVGPYGALMVSAGWAAGLAGRGDGVKEKLRFF